MEFTLSMTFITETGEKANLSLSEVRDDLTEEDVFSLMDTTIENDIFESKKGALTAKYSAVITQRQSTKFEV